MMKRFLSAVFVLLTVYEAVAQPGCPAVDAGPDVTIPCGISCTNITASYLPSGNTSTYTVAPIPYTPFSYNTGTATLVNIDDHWSGVINLPFTFCFYGNSYTQVIIGSNGVVSFNTSNANGYNTWPISSAVPTTAAADIENCIMAPWQDIDPTYQGDIYWQIGGTYPCRYFIASWYRVAYYGDPNSVSTGSCPTAYYLTAQAVLYETSNAIDIYIKDKNYCSGWNGGYAIEGIQNANGTAATVVPGRNYPSQWNAHNDAYRFTPSGPSIVSFGWYQGGTLIDTNLTIQVCPSQQSTTYTAQAIYTPCSGGNPITVTDDMVVSLTGTLITGIDSSRNVTCYGGSNGAAYAHVSGGTAPVTYGWSNGDTALAITGLSAGTYVFTAADAASCTRRDTVIITQPTQIVPVVTNVSLITCPGFGQGSLPSSTTGGTGPYTYLWSSNPPQTDSVLQNVTAGTYTITATDATGCTGTGSGTLTITQGGNNTVVTLVNHTDISCSGNTDGAITVNATGNGNTYAYVWSTSDTGPTIDSLAAGVYSVTADNGAGCTATLSDTIIQPAPLVINQPVITNIGCGGVTQGTISVNVIGGTAAYSYDWMGNGQTYTGSAISVAQPGNYALTVTDAHGCTDTASYDVQQVPDLLFTQASANVTCNGGSDGSATITVTQGTPPYQFNWNHTGNSPNATYAGQPAGNISVVISDANCVDSTTFVLNEPTAVVISLLAKTNISCNGGNDGSVSISAAGGTPAAGNSYNYAWDNGQTTATATGLTAGTYNVTVTDANNCPANATYSLTEPTPLLSNPVPDSAICYNTPSGSIDANPSGGTPPYNFLWGDPASQESQIATGLYSGSYTCLVTDNNGCTVDGTGNVGQPNDLMVDTSSTPVLCIGDENGSITLAATGGNPPYTYSATLDGSNFHTTTNGVIEQLATGTYMVYINDDKGCTKIISVTVPNANPDEFNTSTDSTLCYGPDYNDGGAHIIATSIVNGPYMFSIDGGTQQYSGDFFNLSAGQHTITAQNGNGCLTDVPVVVLQPLPIVVDVVPDTIFLPLGESQQVQVTYLNANNVSYQWGPFTGLSCQDCANPVVGPYQSGDYVVTVSMQNGTATCYGYATLHAEVDPHNPVFIPNAFTPNGDGNNDKFLIYGEDIKTVSLKIFDRWGEEVFDSGNHFEGWDGTYRGQLELPQVFTYEAEITFLDNKKQNRKGTVTLIR